MPERRHRPFRPGHYKPPSAPHDSTDGGDGHRDRYDWITLWIAIIGVIVVSVSTAVAAWQAMLTRDTLANAINQQRAWVKVDVEPAGGFIVLPDRADLGLIIRVTNVGSVPALYTRGSARLYPMPTTDNLTARSPYGPLLTCDARKRHSKIDVGITVFPGESTRLEMEIPSAERKYIQALTDRSGLVGFVTSICVEYETGPTRTIHRTGAIYTIADAARVEKFDFVSAGDGVQRRNVLLERLGIGDIAN